MVFKYVELLGDKTGGKMKRAKICQNSPEKRREERKRKEKRKEKK